MLMPPGAKVINQNRRQLLSTPTKRTVAAGAVIAVVLAVLGSMALAQQDKYTVQVPNGLAFSEFRGYEDWPVIAISESGGVIAVTVGKSRNHRRL